MRTSKNILICPLEWGLGHAGRMIPVAAKLLSDGNNVFIGSGEGIAAFFRREIEGLKYIHFPGFTIRYSRRLPQYIKIALSAPLFFYHIRKEHRLLRRIIREYKIDIVISDSRLGLWNREAKTAFVTHMMRIPFPRYLSFLENRGAPLLNKIFSKFDYCFIPDLPGELNLSGKLSHAIEFPDNVRYIGILSRFSNGGKGDPVPEWKYFCTVILSGPEPQRSLLKRRLEIILEKSGRKCLFLEGRPGGTGNPVVCGNIEFISHLPAAEMKEALLQSRHIITRSGYTTIMELVSIGKSALLIPTPGQSEQEYLADLMTERCWFASLSQGMLYDLPDLPGSDPKWPETINGESARLLGSALTELLQ